MMVSTKKMVTRANKKASKATYRIGQTTVTASPSPSRRSSVGCATPIKIHLELTLPGVASAQCSEAEAEVDEQSVVSGEEDLDSAEDLHEEAEEEVADEMEDVAASESASTEGTTESTETFASDNVSRELLVDLHEVCDELEKLVTKELKKQDTSSEGKDVALTEKARRQKATACLMDLLSVEEDLMTIALLCGHDEFVGQCMSPKKAKLVGGAARGLKERVCLAPAVPAAGDSPLRPPLAAGELSSPLSTPRTPRSLRAAVLLKAGVSVSDADAMRAGAGAEGECPAVSVLLERVESSIAACQGKMLRLGMLGEL